MNFPIFRRVLNSDLTCTQRMIMVVILNHSNGKGTSWPSQETIAKQSGLSRKAVNENLSSLEKTGWIKRENGAGRNHILTVGDCNPRLQLESPEVTHGDSLQCNPQLQVMSLRVTGDVTEGYNDVTEGYTKYPVTPIEPPIEPPMAGIGAIAVIQEPSKPKRRKPKLELEPIDPPFDSPEFAESWNEWIEYLKEIKKPVTPTSRKAQFRKFEKWGESQSIEAIENSISNQWQGLFPPDQRKQGKPKDESEFRM